MGVARESIAISTPDGGTIEVLRDYPSPGYPISVIVTTSDQTGNVEFPFALTDAESRQMANALLGLSS